MHRDLPGNPVWVMLNSWRVDTGRRFIADVVVNIGLYIPLGMSGYLAFRRWRMVVPVLLAVVVSSSIETLQLFAPGRDSSAIDFMDNTIGSMAGVALGFLFEKMAGADVIEFGRIVRGHRGALALLFFWVAALFFPFYPETHLPVIHVNLSRFARELFTSGPVPVISSLAGWYVAGVLVNTAGFRHPRFWLGSLLLLLPAQFLIVTRRPDAGEFIGAALGVALFVWLGAPKRHSGMVAWAFIAVLLIRGLVPFHPGPAHPFVWVPFGGFLSMNWQTGLRVLMEKAFYYGAAVWLLRASVSGMAAATGAVMGVLMIIEAVQTRLPGRTAEITEPVLCLLIGCGLWALNPRRRSDVELLPPVRR